MIRIMNKIKKYNFNLMMNNMIIMIMIIKNIWRMENNNIMIKINNKKMIYKDNKLINNRLINKTNKSMVIKINIKILIKIIKINNKYKLILQIRIQSYNIFKVHNLKYKNFHILCIYKPFDKTFYIRIAVEVLFHDYKFYILIFL